MSDYPHLSERLARIFAQNASILRTSSFQTSTVRRFVERYSRASKYLYSRIGR